MSDEDISCPYCDGAAAPYVSARDLNRRLSDVVYHLHRCEVCELLFVANPPVDLGRYYQQDYHHVPKDRAELEQALPGQREKIELLLPHKAGGDLLEIGPSVGYFCALAQDVGFDVSAIEMDEACVAFLSGELGVRAVQSDDPAGVLADEERMYDAICLWHSIEHLHEPWVVIERAIARLKPEGVLLVAAPNPYSRQARMMGRFWPHHDLPRHLFGLSMDWMEKLVGKHGMKTVLRTTRNKEGVYWNRFSWAMKFKGLARRLPWFIEARSWTLGMMFGKLFGFWEDKEGQGACYVMVFQKSEG